LQARTREYIAVVIGQDAVISISPPLSFGVYQFGIEPGVRLAEPFHRLRQLDESPRRCLFQQTIRSKNPRPRKGDRTKLSKVGILIYNPDDADLR
jgi:hypothetical protein